MMFAPKLACLAVVVLASTSSGQATYIKASSPGEVDWFGHACEVNGDTIVIGAWREDSGFFGDPSDDSQPDAGAAYVFVRDGSSWSQQAYLKPSVPDQGDRFGFAVAVDGDTLVIGASGESRAATGVNGSSTDNTCFGSGAAFVFVRNGTTWSQQAYLKSADCDDNDRFGESVDIAGDRVVVSCAGDSSSSTGIGGDPTDNSAPGSGAVYVFHRTGTTWTQEAYLKSSNAESLDAFGTSVSLSGDTLLVGARGEDGGTGNPLDNSKPQSGAAFVFRLRGGSWTQEAYLKASNADTEDDFGVSVALHGDTALISAPEDDSNSSLVNGTQGNRSTSNSGAAYIFVRSGSSWSQQAYLKAINPETGDHFGQNVALSRDLAVVSTRGEDGSGQGLNGDPTSNDMVQAGAAYSFVRSGTQWFQKNYIKSTNTEREDSFGRAIGLDGNRLVVGASNEDGGSSGVDGDLSSNASFDSGAAYVYELDSSPPELPDIGLDSCSGDGGDQMGCTDCPCGNNAAAGTIGGCLNSAGTSPRLFATGDPSVTLLSGIVTDLRFEVTGVPAASLCVLYSGDAVGPGNKANPCFGENSGIQSIHLDSLRCSIQNVRRHGARGATANGDVGITSSPWGGEGGPGAGLAIAGGSFASGQTRHFQVLNREDALLGCMRGLGSTQAVEITFTP